VSGEATPTALDSSSALLTLGTYRDLWAGPITELNPPLKFLQPQQRVEISIADAQRLDLKNGEAVRVSQNGNTIDAAVLIKERIAPGTAFLAEAVTGANANALLNGGPVQVKIEKVRA
jgi:anaerobic selenocysteine-containing dehydrogenase